MIHDATLETPHLEPELALAGPAPSLCPRLPPELLRIILEFAFPTCPLLRRGPLRDRARTCTCHSRRGALHRLLFVSRDFADCAAERLYECLLVGDDGVGRLSSLWSSLGPASRDGQTSRPYSRFVRSISFHCVNSSSAFPQRRTDVVAALKEMSCVRRVRFSSKRVDVWDLVWDCTALLRALEASGSPLEAVIIDGARFSGEQVGQVLAKLDNLSVLEIRRTDAKMRKGIKEAISHGLEELVIRDAFTVLYYAFDGHEGTTKLRKLELGEYRKFPDNGIRSVLASSPDLEEVSLDVFKVTRQLLQHLTTLPHLRLLRLQCPRIPTHLPTWRLLAQRCVLEDVSLEAEWGKAVPTVGRALARMLGGEGRVRWTGMDKIVGGSPRKVASPGKSARVVDHNQQPPVI
ncbi:hypothetical protein DFJ74DRAFT_658776 [Hyaloraphidium curvatum]|nr:hypothetical protein DFJ74DRAFT_658776 [Hyaloraphidium curvatum]